MSGEHETGTGASDAVESELRDGGVCKEGGEMKLEGAGGSEWISGVGVGMDKPKEPG